MINKLIEDTRNGSIAARNQIIEDHLYIIEKVVQKLYDIRIDESTKRYGALLGIMAAIDNFDERKGNFPHYAYRCALNKAQREMNKDWLIRIPNSKLINFFKDKKKPYQLMSISGKNEGVTKWLIPPELDSTEYVEKVLHPLITYDEVNDTEIQNILQECLKELKDCERDAIYYKYGFIDSTLKEVGEKHNISHEWVRLKCKKALKKLTKNFLNKIKRMKK